MRAAALPHLLLFGTDGLCAYSRAIRAAFRDPVRTGVQRRPWVRPWRNLCIAQVVKGDAQRCVFEVERRIVEGTPARVEMLRRRSQDRGVINTAYIERLNATCRERLSSLVRRTLTRRHGRYLIGTIYHFCTLHESPRSAGPAPGVTGVERTLAMAAAFTTRCWCVVRRRPGGSGRWWQRPSVARRTA